MRIDQGIMINSASRKSFWRALASLIIIWLTSACGKNPRTAYGWIAGAPANGLDREYCISDEDKSIVSAIDDARQAQR